MFWVNDYHSPSRDISNATILLHNKNDEIFWKDVLSSCHRKKMVCSWISIFAIAALFNIGKITGSLPQTHFMTWSFEKLDPMNYT